MTKLRFIYAKGLTENSIKKILSQCTNKDEMKDFYKEKREENSINVIFDRFNEFQISKQSKNENEIDLTYNSGIKIPQVDDVIWIKYKTKIFLPMADIVMLQEPSVVFERLFRLSIYKHLPNAAKSPFMGILLSDLIDSLHKYADKNSSSLVIKRIIVARYNDGKDLFDEYNIKQTQISNNLIKLLTRNSDHWVAFSGSITTSEDTFSFRIDQYGKGQIYGSHVDSRAKILLDLISTSFKELLK